MRILHTLAEPSLGGLEFRTLEQASWLQRHGYDVAIAAPSGSAVSGAARERNLTTVDIDFKPAYAPSTVLALRRAVKALNIQVIDSHSRADGKAAALCRDLCAVVRTRHFAKPMRTSPGRRLEWRFGCDHVIATSNVGKQELLAARLFRDDRISVVGEWAGDEFFRQAEDADASLRIRRGLEMPAPDEAYVIATVGMLRPEKGQADLLRVVHRLRALGVPAVALVVGMPTAATRAYAYELYRLAIELGISDHAVFVGHRSDVPDMMRAADVVLVPSAAEAWSRVVPEAYAMGRPVVASDVGGLPEIVVPGQTGWLAAPGDIAGYVDRILQIRHNACDAQAVVTRARTYAETNFRLSEKMFHTLDAYRRAMEPGLRAGAYRSPSAVCAVPAYIEPLEQQAHEYLLTGTGARGRTGILLVHGLAGTPEDMRALALGLHRRGYTVLAVKLAGHCGTLDELVRTSWLDWLASVRRGADLLASRVDHLVVGGQSVGAMLALALAQERPLHVAGVLALSPAFRHDGPGLRRYARLGLLLPLLQTLLHTLRIGGHRVIANRDASLPGIPWRSLAQARKLAVSVWRRMHILRAPCLVLHARNDDIASVSNAFDIVNRACNANVSLHLLDDNRNAMTPLALERNDVTARVAAFVNDIVEAPAGQAVVNVA
ncbi:MAG: alpha/beta fold hydrolase [Achromobacter sp.]|uniref:alpha/beta fold hydrolase n=1 Tax=Achromobacter sp. TaxID=134375 RepID=UPI0029B23B7F|nr:alpha/beta fold hydrolase [Achromobacter sp.]MDX3984407.1 alpha/beta fold hydrolase [Achromobacter sp.]